MWAACPPKPEKSLSSCHVPTQSSCRQTSSEQVPCAKHIFLRGLQRRTSLTRPQQESWRCWFRPRRHPCRSSRSLTRHRKRFQRLGPAAEGKSWPLSLGYVLGMLGNSAWVAFKIRASFNKDTSSHLHGISERGTLCPACWLLAALTYFSHDSYDCKTRKAAIHSSRVCAESVQSNLICANGAD